MGEVDKEEGKADRLRLIEKEPALRNNTLVPLRLHTEYEGKE